MEIELDDQNFSMEKKKKKILTFLTLESGELFNYRKI